MVKNSTENILKISCIPRTVLRLFHSPGEEPHEIVLLFYFTNKETDQSPGQNLIRTNVVYLEADTFYELLFTFNLLHFHFICCGSLFRMSKFACRLGR